MGHHDQHRANGLDSCRYLVQALFFLFFFFSCKIGGRVPMLLALERVMEEKSSNHLANVLINSMGIYSYLKEDIMCQCFNVCFGADGASTL